MSEQLIAKFIREGRLRKQKAGFVQVEALLKEAIADLLEAKKIVDLAERATYILAYTAMFKAGRALLLFKGYTPIDGAQHKTVVEMTSSILGKKFQSLTDHFETMRRKRNNLTYEAGELLTMSEAKAAFQDAIDLVNEVLKEVKSTNPQIELKFGLGN